MRKTIDPQRIRERYQRMSDQELTKAAISDSSGLIPLAIEIVQTEIEKRGLDPKLMTAILAQNKQYTLAELDVYCNIISQLSCPVCGNTREPLNATMVNQVISFVVATTYSKKLKVACPRCLNRAHTSASTLTALVGWWGFPWGLIRTPMALYRNMRSRRTNHWPEPNDYLRSFVLARIGAIITYREDRDALQQLLRVQNV